MFNIILIFKKGDPTMIALAAIFALIGFASCVDISAFDPRTGVWVDRISVFNGPQQLCGKDNAASFSFTAMSNPMQNTVIPAYDIVIILPNNTDPLSYVVTTRTSQEGWATIVPQSAEPVTEVVVPGILDSLGHETTIVSIFVVGFEDTCFLIKNVELRRVVVNQPKCSAIVTVYGRVANEHTMAIIIQQSLHLADASVSAISLNDDYDQWVITSTGVCDIKSQLPLLVVSVEDAVRSINGNREFIVNMSIIAFGCITIIVMAFAIYARRTVTNNDPLSSREKSVFISEV
jgi:hypothetical protein